MFAAALAIGVASIDAIASQTPPSPPRSQVFPSDPIWTVDISAKPLTAPVASGDRLFLALESGISARRIADGSEIWNAKIIAEGPMAALGDRLIVASKGEVHGLAAASGETVWTEKIGALTAPPVVAGDTLLLATGQQLSAHRVADGSRTWSRDVGVIEQRSAISDGRVYVPVSDGRLLVLDLASGEPVWEREDVGIKPTEPLVEDDRVIFGTAAKKFCSLRRDTGVEQWCFTIGAGLVGAPVSDGTRVYVVALDNQLYAHDRSSGNRRWKRSLGYRPSAGPTLIGRTVTAPGREAKLQAFDALTGSPGAALALPATMVEAPVFIPPAENGLVRVAALGGGLENVWKLTLAWPPPIKAPEMKVESLSELPGRAVPIGTPRVPPE
jgi:outer membrane protein assembly factor BamB